MSYKLKVHHRTLRQTLPENFLVVSIYNLRICSGILVDPAVGGCAAAHGPGRHGRPTAAALVPKGTTKTRPSTGVVVDSGC